MHGTPIELEHKSPEIAERPLAGGVILLLNSTCQILKPGSFRSWGNIQGHASHQYIVEIYKAF